jgi:Tfp pilus assembly protein PilV
MNVTAATTRRQYRGVNKALGVGLIEVMAALFVFALGALAIANMQGTAITNVKTSDSHFAINSLGEEIAEHLKASAVVAGSGNLNTDFSESVVSSSVPSVHAATINGWKKRVSDVLPQGQSRIACVIDSCDVSLQWRGAGLSGVSTQTYNLKFPLADN